MNIFKTFGIGVAGLVTAILVFYVWSVFASWQYRECLAVGHTELYCQVFGR